MKRLKNQFHQTKRLKNQIIMIYYLGKLTLTSPKISLNDIDIPIFKTNTHITYFFEKVSPTSLKFCLKYTNTLFILSSFT